MSKAVTFQDITQEYDNIIKSKWKLMEEVDCLPDAITARIGFTQRMDRYIHNITSRSEAFDPLFLFWQGLELLVCDAHGTTPIAKWELEMSTVQPNAVKGIRLVTLMRDMPIEEVLTHAAAERADQNMSSMWSNLPKALREKEENWVCPQCHKRGMRIGEYSYGNRYLCSDTHYAVTCNHCEYIAKEAGSRYDAVESFLKRYQTELKRFEKKEKFQAKAKESLSVIEQSLNEMAALAQSRAVLYDEGDLKWLRKQTDTLVAATFCTLEERLNNKKKG